MTRQQEAQLSFLTGDKVDCPTDGCKIPIILIIGSMSALFSPLEQWVEKGIAPEAIIATKYIKDLDPTQGIKMTRPLCPYPQIATYKGTGDTIDAVNFVCTLKQ